MNLTGQEIVDKGIVFGPISEENIQQHGVDCNLIGVKRIVGKGFVPTEGKTILTQYQPMLPAKVEILMNNDGKPHTPVETRTAFAWQLEPGVYDITLAQGCRIPPDQRMKLIHRSSIYRNGSNIVSALWDAGFETQNMGTVLHVFVPIQIEVGARVCQAYCTSSNIVDNLYDGQFQKDSQREDGREGSNAN